MNKTMKSEQKTPNTINNMRIIHTWIRWHKKPIENDTTHNTTYKKQAPTIEQITRFM